MYRILCYNDACVLLASIQNRRHVKQKLLSFGALEVYADGNLASHVNAWILGPHDSNFQIPFPNIYISGATPPENVIYTS